MMNSWRQIGCAVFVLAGAVARCEQVQTGSPFFFRPEPAGGPESVRYLIDWGDGTLTPTAHGEARFSPVLSKVWNERGEYRITPVAISLSGRTIPLKPVPVTVRGLPSPSAPRLQAKRFSQNRTDGRLEERAFPRETDEPYAAQSIGMLFDRMVSLDELVLTKEPGFPFPDHFCVEFSTDGGNVWQDVPSAIYTFFPDPGEKEVRISLNGLTVNAVRVVSYRPPQGPSGGHALRLGRLEAIGSDRLLFEMDTDPQTAADWNNLWLVYGSAKNELKFDFTGYPHPTDRPDEGGMLMIGSTIWAHWNSMKISWLDEPEAKNYFETTVNTYPQDERGLMGVSPGSFYHLDHSKHYVTPSIFISGMAHWFLMHRDEPFLQTRDRKTGTVLLDKVRKAMGFLLDDLDGRSGLVTIRDPDHDGSPNGKPGNYWDVWRFGYKSAYDNLLFYQALDWMARMETALGNRDQAETYQSLRSLVKQRFNETFWNEETGRFIGWEDINGSRQDYGFTWVNLEAVACGIADDQKARRILEWLDGERIVYGDTSVRDDIYYWRVAPRANTVSAETNPAYWDTWTMQVGPGTQGEYGGQIQNGGHIFYVSYYDLMSRLRTKGIDDAMRRMNVILDEFHKDQLRRKPGNRLGSTHVEGILREFPESGLVPLFFITGILGLESDADGLRIAPALPNGWDFAAVNEFWFAGRPYSIRVQRGRGDPVIRDGQVTVFSEGIWRLTPGGAVEEIR